MTPRPATETPPQPPFVTRATLRALMSYFGRLGSSGFGGPIALVGSLTTRSPSVSQPPPV